jgi:pantoate--beta-alanine ligase
MAPLHSMTPETATTIEAVRAAVGEARKRGATVGLVPTMGALHAGHLSLIEAARRETGYVVATIFVNPAQFGPSEDFTRYPRPLERDLDLSGQSGVDLVFVPEVQTIYPSGFSTYVEVQGLQDLWEGASRPGHFRGVATVVLKLFNIVRADVAYFGQKDAQQARIIQQMVHDLDVPIRIQVCPIIREPDGLALSSRNVYLDAEQRKNAVVLSQALQEAKTKIEAGERSTATIQQGMTRRIEATPGAMLDYAAVVDAITLKSLDWLKGEILLALAVRFGATRLIDNVLLRVE